MNDSLATWICHVIMVMNGAPARLRFMNCEVFRTMIKSLYISLKMTSFIIFARVSCWCSKNNTKQCTLNYVCWIYFEIFFRCAQINFSIVCFIKTAKIIFVGLQCAAKTVTSSRKCMQLKRALLRDISRSRRRVAWRGAAWRGAA